MNPAQLQALSDQAIALVNAGRLAECEQACIQLRQADPRSFIGCYLQGVIQFGRGEKLAAKSSMDAAIAAEPYAPQPWIYHGLLLEADGKDDQALSSYSKALALEPEMVEAMAHRGNMLQRQRRFANAFADFDLAVQLRPDFLPALLGRGLALESLGKTDEALAAFDQLLARDPGLAAAWNSRAAVLRTAKRLDDALVSVDKALALQPDYPDAWNNRGTILRDMKRLDEALASYDKALAIQPDHAFAWNNRGVALRNLKRTDEALACYDKAIAIAPNYAYAWDNRGVALLDQKKPQEALACFDKAIAFQPDYADAWNNRGFALQLLNRLDEALASIEKATQLNPNSAEAWSNRCATLHDLKRLEEALACANKAVTLRPDDANAWNNHAAVLLALDRPEESAASSAKTMAIDPDYDLILGHYLSAKMKACDWDGLAQKLAQCAAGIEAGNNIIAPFTLLGVLDDPSLQKKAARIFSEARYPARALPAWPKRPDGSKIRIGYYSADFHHHATAFLIAQMLEVHDPSRFELIAFSFGPDATDSMRKRIAAPFHQFIDVRGMNDAQVASLSRERGIDIAVDLKGHTQDSRENIFAEGAAPIQVQYLGYPGTMGADYFHYVIGDPIVIPAGAEADYTEKVVRLPHSYQPNDSTRKISTRIFTREEGGLPPSGFVFCCFNNGYKILPETFDSWMRILKAVEDSVLWLREDNKTASENLRKRATAQGIDPARLVFSGFMRVDDHLARHRLADLFLDTLPYNAHTTASDALWAGLPVLTCMGKSFASRVAASLLNAVGLPELITDTREDYESLAITLAQNPARLAALKQKLADNRTSAPLFNGALTARHLEKAYEAMLSRHRAGLAPDHIDVAPC